MVKRIIYITIAIFIGLQFIPSKVENPKTDPSLELKASPKIMAAFKRACYDCHSNQVKLPWYSHVAPVSFMIKRHVDLGRAWLNFSVWETYSEKKKDKKLKEIFKAVYLAMPLSSYLSMHKDAKLSKEEIQMIRDWTGKAPY